MNGILASCCRQSWLDYITEPVYHLTLNLSGLLPFSHPVLSEELIKYAHKISASNSVACPPGWTPGDQRRPYPSGNKMSCHEIPLLTTKVVIYELSRIEECFFDLCRDGNAYGLAGQNVRPLMESEFRPW